MCGGTGFCMRGGTGSTSRNESLPMVIGFECFVSFTELEPWYREQMLTVEIESMQTLFADEAQALVQREGCDVIRLGFEHHLLCAAIDHMLYRVPHQPFCQPLASPCIAHRDHGNIPPHQPSAFEVSIELAHNHAYG